MVSCVRERVMGGDGGDGHHLPCLPHHKEFTNNPHSRRKPQSSYRVAPLPWGNPCGSLQWLADRLGGPVQLLAALTWSSDVGILD